MPFIKGRFHINPIAGQALEAAREAEAALLALEHAAQQERQRQGNDDGDGRDGYDANVSNSQASAPNDGPIDRVEIEASELVPSHQGRAVRGYVARVHRQPVAQGQSASSAPPESHVFADHRDLVSFLRDELAKDCK